MKYTICYVYFYKFIEVWHKIRDGRQKGGGCDSCGGRGIIMRWLTLSFSAYIFAIFVSFLLYLLLRIIHEYSSYCIIGN